MIRTYKAGRVIISIHAPREGGDPASAASAAGDGDFNPRPPRGGRRPQFPRLAPPEGISIHAPREGGDHYIRYLAPENDEFQSTPPARGATIILHIARGQSVISIHAPREGGD